VELRGVDKMKIFLGYLALSVLVGAILYALIWCADHAPPGDEDQ
jgi:hypothetical protein